MNKTSIPRAPKAKKPAALKRPRITTGLPRYDREEVQRFMESLHTIAAASRKKPEAELRVNRILRSMKKDVKAGFAGRPHQDDVLNISRARVEWLLPQVRKGRAAVQLTQWRSIAEEARKFLALAERKVAELDHSRGSAVHHERQAVIQGILSRAS